MRIRTGATCAALLLLVVACGGDDGGDEALLDDPAALHVYGSNDLTWEPETMTAEAGTITFALECGQAVHDLVIEETDEEIARCSPNEVRGGEIELDAGEYTYVCTIPGHQNMRGTLTVT